MPLAGGGATADGFAALAQEDTNADGVVNNLDTRWSQLRVWQDLNQDGISQAGELLTMEEAGITGFNVASVEHNQLLRNGNQIADTGSYTKTDGTTGLMGEINKMADVNLTDDTFYREFPDQIPLAEGVAALPEMQGSGKVRDLHEAASQSGRLQDLLTQYSQATTRQAQLTLLDQLLDAWADTSGMAESFHDRVEGQYNVCYRSFGSVRLSNNLIDPDTSGNFIVEVQGGGGGSTIGENTNISPAYLQLIARWNQKIHILEAFNGRCPSFEPSFANGE